jgi:single stranded DNA-binding protein
MNEAFTAAPRTRVEVTRQWAAPEGDTTMLDTQVTVVGNVATDPRMSETKDGHHFTSFRIASTPRRFDRGSGEWRDGDTLYASVTCWRGLAENTATCLKKGHGVIVVGRLSHREYETRDGAKRQTVEIDAVAIGPDLGRAVAIVKRAERSLSAVPAPAAAVTDGTPAVLADLGLPESIDWELAAAEPAPDPELESEPESELESEPVPELVGAGVGSSGGLIGALGRGKSRSNANSA